ncbi:MAG: MFS transporter [Chitinophagaceae bacterium]
MINLPISLPTQRYYRIGVSTFFFIQGLTFASWTSRIPDIKNKLHLSDGAFGGVLFALPAGQLTAMALSGYLVSKYGSKLMLQIAALLFPAVLLLLGVVDSTWELIAALFAFGICGNLSNIAVNTQGVGVERLYGRSIMASFHGLWSLAGFTGGLISLMIAGFIPPFTHFLIIYGITFLLLISARGIVLPRDTHAASSEGKKLFVKPDRYIIILGLIAFACMICEGTMFEWSVIYFESVLKVSQNLIRIGFVSFMCTMAGGRFAADYYVMKYGVDRVLKLSGVFIFSGLMLAVLFPNIFTATLGFLLVGIGVSSVVPMVYSLAGKSKKMLPGVALAAVSSISFLGFLIGPPIIGFIAQVSNLRWSFALIALLGLGTTLLSGKIKQE